MPGHLPGLSRNAPWKKFRSQGIDRDDAEYILSTFKAIHDDSTLFPGSTTIAQRILQKYAEMSFPA